MIPPISANEFDLMRTYIEQQCGIALSNGKEYLIESRLANLVAESGSRNFGEFFLKVKNGMDEKVREKIIDAMTTNETMWFRDNSPYVTLEEVILPEFLEMARKGVKTTFRIWSAAASTGQEPYSIAMIITEFARKMGGTTLTPAQFEIIGTDISPSALFMAMNARYDQISITRGMRKEYQDRYFTQNGKVWMLSDQIKKMVTFKKFNLQNNFAPLGSFDLVFCRNVAIYFSEDFKRELFRKISNILRPKGVFIIGSAESLSGYSTDFTMQEHKGSIYYRNK